MHLYAHEQYFKIGIFYWNISHVSAVTIKNIKNGNTVSKVFLKKIIVDASTDFSGNRKVKTEKNTEDLIASDNNQFKGKYVQLVVKLQETPVNIEDERVQFIMTTFGFSLTLE